MALLAAVLGAAPPVPAKAPPDIPRQVLEAIGADRLRLGVAGLDRRKVLDAAAARRARRIAALPEDERMSLDSPIEEDLHALGVRRVHRARFHLDLQLGSRHPAESILERWHEYGLAWDEAMDSRLDAAGAAVVEAEDEWLVFVAILVEDVEFPDDLRAMEREVREGIDHMRLEHSLPPLERLAELAKVARAHSRDMSRRGFFSHVTPTGEDLADRLGRTKVAFRRCAENISLAAGVEDPVRTAVTGWMESAGHRANILDPAFTHTGVGIAIAEDGTLYFTQVFLRPP